MASPIFVLVHSPIVGPATWIPVADELRRRGHSVVVPDLGLDDGSDTPFWARHTRAALDGLQDVPSERELILVGHSGAGVLLPPIGHAAHQPIAGYVFVDAGIPKDGLNRLANGAFAAYIRDLFAQGDRYPNWTDDDLRPIVSDADLRRLILNDLRPPPLAFWEELIPVSQEWPDAPCGYLRFVPNPAYDAAAAQAQSRGWTYSELSGGHFQPLVDPRAVAAALLALVTRLAGR